MLIIGSRGSALALAQTNWIREKIIARFPAVEVSVHVIRTSADKDTTSSIRSGAAVGVFVKELEQALLQKEIDLAVHSMKDLPTSIPDGLRIAAIPEREEAQDALITGGASGLFQLPAGARIGTGSIRRQAQILALRPDLKILDIRGNIETRLRKLQEGTYDAIVLACAGLNRLGLGDRIAAKFSTSEMLPAPGQGALAVEARDDDARLVDIAAALNHLPTFQAVTAERAFLQRMGGGCNVPVAAYARVAGGFVEMDGLVASPDGSRALRSVLRGDCDTAVETAMHLADEILARGGRDILESLE
jgi:hydroxymethylbilane synthase